MQIRIGNHTEYLDIKDIVPEGKEFGCDSKSIEFLRGTLGLKANGVSADIRVSLMIGEIQQLRTNLQRLYDSLKYEFVFTNIEDNVKIRFTPTPNGQVEMKGYLRNADYSVTIHFEIVTDQTFLPETINQIKDALDFKPA